MNRTLKICYTADCHGEYRNLAGCFSSFAKDGNTLILDGGDNLQGSPLTYYLYNKRPGVHTGSIPAQIMNCGGYDFFTLGNHDFSFGPEALEAFLEQTDAVCLCANVSGLSRVKKTAVVTLQNGLRVGLTGLTNPCVPKWEPAENVRGVTFTDAFTAAEEVLEELKKAGPDVTVCLYHGGYEDSPERYVSSDRSASPVLPKLPTGPCAPLSEPVENQGLYIAEALGFDILLTAHQHNLFHGGYRKGTFTCQAPNKAETFLRVEWNREGGASTELISTRADADHPAMKLVADVEEEMKSWQDCVIGVLDRPLPVQDPLTMALQGSMLANFINQVQTELTGADLSCTSFSNSPSGLTQSVTNGAVAACYVFPNTLKVLRVNRTVLKAALERSASYFHCSDNGELGISPEFLTPMVQHFNYDYFSGLHYTFDLTRPAGDRVISMKVQGKELEDGQSLTLATNSYRASGAGGYPLFAQCGILFQSEREIAELLTGYLQDHTGEIPVDTTEWLHVIVQGNAVI